MEAGMAIRRVLYLFVSLLALAIIGFVILVLIADTPEKIPKTVAQNPLLPRLEINGTKLHVQSFGDSQQETIVVLHGGPGSDFRSLLALEALKDSYQIVFYDQRGSGLSERRDTKTDFNLDTFLEDLDQVADHFSPQKPFHLVGHSWGAMLASGYLAKYPQKVKSAVLVEPGFLTPKMGNQFMQRTGYMQPPLSWALVKELLDIAAMTIKVDPVDPHAKRDFFLQRLMTAEVPDHPIAGYFCEGSPGKIESYRFGTHASVIMQKSAMDKDKQITFDVSTGLDKYLGPVLFVASECNTLIGEDVQKEHLKLFKNAELKVMPKVGHNIFSEAPDRSVEMVRNYLKGLTKTSTGAAPR